MTYLTGVALVLASAGLLLDRRRARKEARWLGRPDALRRVGGF